MSSEVNRSMQCLLLCGSLRTPSRTLTLLHHTAELLTDRGLTCTVWNPVERPVPLFEPIWEHRAAEHPEENVRALAAAAAAADCFVWGSPVYHNSYTGAFKNLLDYLRHECVQKPIGLVGSGSGQQALDHMRIIARGLRGVGTTIQVAAGSGDFTEENGAYRLSNPTILKRSELFADDLVWFTQKLRT